MESSLPFHPHPQGPLCLFKEKSPNFNVQRPGSASLLLFCVTHSDVALLQVKLSSGIVPFPFFIVKDHTFSQIVVGFTFWESLYVWKCVSVTLYDSLSGYRILIWNNYFLTMLKTDFHFFELSSIAAESLKPFLFCFSSCFLYSAGTLGFLFFLVVHVLVQHPDLYITSLSVVGAHWGFWGESSFQEIFLFY